MWVIRKKLGESWTFQESNDIISGITFFSIRIWLDPYPPNLILSQVSVCSAEERDPVVSKEDVDIDIQSSQYRIIGPTRNKIKIFTYNAQTKKQEEVGLVQEVEINSKENPHVFETKLTFASVSTEREDLNWEELAEKEKQLQEYKEAKYTKLNFIGR